MDYTIDSYVYKKSFELVKEDRDDLTRIAHLFKYVVDTLDYDDQKAKDVSETFVLPDIDGSLKSHKGICFDYAASLAALCRIQGIPAKVIVGWTDIEYHAWVEIYLKDKGWINPKIYFKKEKAEESMKYFENIGEKLTAVLSGASWIDIANKTESKGNAIKAICEKYGIAHTEAMGFGDYLNDMSLLESCGESYCMKNGHPTLKALAKYVTEKTNDENGVMEVLKTL